MHIAAIIVLLVMLIITTLALFSSIAEADGNVFQTAQVKISLNGGEKIFHDDDFQLSPGSSIEKSFTVKNESNVEAYYRLYFENVNGPLENAVEFQIYDGDNLIYQGKPAQLVKTDPCLAPRSLQAGETHTLSIKAVMLDASGNTYQNAYLEFDVAADAVQVRNNPDKKFD